jgi:LmbE family N-acetylglucosaminyl deacetylase
MPIFLSSSMASTSENPFQSRAAAAGVSSPPGGSLDSPSPRSDMLLAVRPHLQLRGELLCSVGLPDRRRQLSAAELQLWLLMQQSVSVQDALRACGPGADRLIRGFLREEICELVEPEFAANRPRVLIVEPHADDAVLSLGATLWLRRHACAFVIATMASRSNHTRYRDLGGEHDIATVMDIRRREAELTARMLGGEHVSVGLTDAPLRYHDAEWSRDFYRRHRLSIGASIARAPDAAELRRWTDALQRLVSEQQPAEIWFPLGGPHADHMLTADACLAAFTGDPSLVRGRVLRIYQEVPYAVRYPRHMNTALAAVRRSGVVLEEESTPTAPVLAEKRRLASIYDSQETEELFAAGGELAETFWRVRDLPPQALAAGLLSRAIAEDTPALRSIAAWVARNRDAALVRVLLTAPTGRWQADLRLLASAFPRARFEVCAATAAGAEVLDAACSRVDARTVAGGTWAWLRETLRMCLSRPGPILVHAAEARAPQAHMLASVWFGSDTLVITSMDRLAAALRMIPDAY